jgi:hypothetical protein
MRTTKTQIQSMLMHLQHKTGNNALSIYQFEGNPRYMLCMHEDTAEQQDLTDWLTASEMYQFLRGALMFSRLKDSE